MQDLNRHVAISEEFSNLEPDKVKSGGLMFDRRVSRIITPGTLIDERFLDPHENNFLLALHAQASVTSPALFSASGVGETTEAADSSSSVVGLAWLDLSTGDFFTQTSKPSSLASSLARIGPREIILNELSQEGVEGGLISGLRDYRHLITYLPLDTEVSLPTAGSVESQRSLSSEDYLDSTSEEIFARNILLRYAESRLPGLDLKLQPPTRRHVPETMSIDKHSMRALEIKTTLKDGHFKGSLLHALRRTVTSGGSRLLSDWLSKCPNLSLFES